MSFWARLFGRTPPARPVPTFESRSLGKERTRALLSNAASKQIIRSAVERLEKAGLRLRPEFDRDLIVVRCLRTLADIYGHDDLAAALEKGAPAKVSFDLDALWALASETDAFFGLDYIDTILPKLSDLSDEDLDKLLERHSYSVFENAFALCIVNEHEPEAYVRQHVVELYDLACGDFEIQSIDASQQADKLLGRVTLTSGQSAAFEFGAEKRPDLTPFFKSMNHLIEPLGRGRFFVVLTGNSEELDVLYLRPSEEIAFRAWAGRQHGALGPAPVDWLE